MNASRQSKPISIKSQGIILNKSALATATHRSRGRAMRIIIAIAVLACSLWLAGCSSPSAIFIGEFPRPTDVTELEPEPSPTPNASIESPIKMVSAAMAQEAPKDIVASQIRSQGYACNSPQNVERDASASKPNEAVWTLNCQNACYRVTLIPSMPAKVDKVGAASPSPPRAAL